MCFSRAGLDTLALCRSACKFLWQQSVAWSQKKERKERRLERKEKRARKRRANVESGEVEDWGDLEREVRLLKKLKRGKITQAEFDAQNGDDL